MPFALTLRLPLHALCKSSPSPSYALSSSSPIHSPSPALSRPCPPSLSHAAPLSLAIVCPCPCTPSPSPFGQRQGRAMTVSLITCPHPCPHMPFASLRSRRHMPSPHLACHHFALRTTVRVSDDGEPCCLPSLHAHALIAHCRHHMSFARPHLTYPHSLSCALMHTVAIAIAHPYMDTLAATCRLEWTHLIYFSTWL